LEAQIFHVVTRRLEDHTSKPVIYSRVISF
jgi:hypothetical protein